MHKIIVLSVTAAAIVCSVYASGPMDAQSTQPLVIIDAAVNNGVLTANVKNISANPVTGYALVVRAHDAKGGDLGQGSAIDLPNPANLPASAFAPGTIRRLKPMQLPKGAIGIPTIKVDYVRFIDGDSWGEDSAKESLRIQGMEAGLKAARNQLRSILRLKGPQGVADALNSPH